MHRWQSWLGRLVSHMLQPPMPPPGRQEPDPEPPALAYIEKTLADSYRKEIDQEENVWHSLPFFTATLALQVTALVQIFSKLPAPATALGIFASGLLVCTALLDLIALGFLCLSIWPRRFNYVASEPELLNYAQGLIRDEEEGEADETQERPASALVTLKWTLARQYAIGADHNRQINKQRERWRARAGLSIVFAVLVTFFLVATIYGQYLYNELRKGTGHAAVHAQTAAPAQSRTGTHAKGNAGQPKSPPAAAHARGG
jgi:hypothetical protein